MGPPISVISLLISQSTRFGALDTFTLQKPRILRGEWVAFPNWPVCHNQNLCVSEPRRLWWHYEDTVLLWKDGWTWNIDESGSENKEKQCKVYVWKPAWRLAFQSGNQKHINRTILFFIPYPLLVFYTNDLFILYHFYAWYIHILSAFMNGSFIFHNSIWMIYTGKSVDKKDDKNLSRYFIGTPWKLKNQNPCHKNLSSLARERRQR